jgi:hypothetical protein
MKQFLRRMGLSIGIAVVLFAAVAVISSAQQSAPTVPLDRTAVFKTHEAHANSNFWGAKAPSPTPKPGGGGGGGGGNGHGGGSGGGGGSAYYTVGSLVWATTTAPAAEEHIAVDPNNSSNLVAAISDFSARDGWNTTKYAWSSDGGSTWDSKFVENSGLNPGDSLLTSDRNAWEANSDPVVAIDSSGYVYLADLYFNGSDNANGLYVGASTPGGGPNLDAAHTYPVAVNDDPNTSTFEDKEWITVDNSGTTNNVYVTWTRFVGNLDMIMFSKSINQGMSWSTPIQVSDPALNGAVQGSQVAVGPNGEIYVTFEVYYVGNQRAHFFTKSTNGGETWSPYVAATPLFGALKFNSTYRKEAFSSLAVGLDGTIYVVYANQPRKGSSQISCVVGSTSTDGTVTFTSPITVNDSSTGERLMPSVAADTTGIHVSWFDTRNGSGSTALYDIYATHSGDGSTFSSNQRITPTSINAGSSSFIGDYGGIAATGGVAHPVWTDGGFNGGRLQTATLTKK